MKYLYESHLGGLFWDDEMRTFEDLYCDECGDCDCYVGAAANEKEARKLLDEYNHPFRDENEEDIDDEDKEYEQYPKEIIEELLQEFKK